MVNAQEWLDKNYPLEGVCLRGEKEGENRYRKEDWNNKGKKRGEIINLDISNQQLEGNLKLEGFANLKELNCYFNSNITSLKIIGSPNLNSLSCLNSKITELEIGDFSGLRVLFFHANLLTDLDLSQNKELEILDISDNNFLAQDLSFLSHLVNLKWLRIGNSVSWKNSSPEICNRFSGSLEPLKNLTQLGELGIGNTDLDSGLEYLPFSLNWFSCLVDERENAKVKSLETELKKFGEVGDNKDFIHLLNKWRKINLVPIISSARERMRELEEKNTSLEEENANLEEELQMEREEAKKALEKAKEWRERQLKEITAQKDREIQELKAQLEKLQFRLEKKVKEAEIKQISEINESKLQTKIIYKKTE